MTQNIPNLSKTEFKVLHTIFKNEPVNAHNITIKTGLKYKTVANYITYLLKIGQIEIVNTGIDGRLYAKKHNKKVVNDKLELCRLQAENAELRQVIQNLKGEILSYQNINKLIEEITEMTDQDIADAGDFEFIPPTPKILLKGKLVADVSDSVKIALLKQLEELSDYIPAEIYTKKVIEIQSNQYFI